jgi:hypothetical protein
MNTPFDSFKLTGISLILMCLSACSGSSAVQDSDGSTSTDGTVVVSQTSTDDQDYQLDVTLTGDLLDGLVGDGNVHFTVWGYDSLVADVAATAILTTSVPVKPVLETYELRFSSEDLDSVEYQSGGEDSLGYYLTFYVDINSDDQLCNGDLRQNFELLDMQFFSASERIATIEIPTTLVSNEGC